MQGDARSRKARMIGTTAQLGVLAGFAVLLWSTAPGPPERFLTALVGAVLAIGVVGRYGTSRESSRLPPVAQGVIVGGLIGALVTVIALGELHTWALLGFLLALPPLFPRVVPARWRPMATANWSDLVAEGEPHR